MSHVRYDVEENIATLTLDRPERLNAFTDTMERELMACLDRSDADDQVRAVIITGAGRAFCAGMDLAEADADDTFAAWRASDTAPPGTQYRVPGQDLPVRRDGGGRVALRIWDSLKPVISAINGHAIGVGATLTLPTDIRLSSTEATFAFPFTRRAVVPESCSSWFLPRVVPPQQALEWMLTGRRFDAAEALRGGLVRSLHSPEELIPAARALAAEIVQNASPVSASLTRQMVWRMLASSHPMEAHQVETWALNLRGVSPDAKEGVRAFLGKRSPEFVDAVSTDLPPVFSVLAEQPAYVPPPGDRP